ASNASQLVVNVPEPTGSATSNIELRFYLSNGVFYKQRSDQYGTSSGTALISNVLTLKFNYYQTTGSTRLSADPGNANGLSTNQATEVLITVITSQDSTTTEATALVQLRNYLPGF